MAITPKLCASWPSCLQVEASDRSVTSKAGMMRSGSTKNSLPGTRRISLQVLEMLVRVAIPGRGIKKGPCAPPVGSFRNVPATCPRRTPWRSCCCAPARRTRLRDGAPGLRADSPRRTRNCWRGPSSWPTLSSRGAEVVEYLDSRRPFPTDHPAIHHFYGAALLRRQTGGAKRPSRCNGRWAPQAMT